MVRARRHALAVLIPSIFLLLLTACSSPRNTGEGPRPTPPPATTTAPDRDGDGIPDTSDAWPDDSTNNPKPVAIAICPARFTIIVGEDGRPDFKTVWAARARDCDVTRNTAPLTDVEREAYEASGYEDSDITTLYSICAAIDPEDVYAQAGFKASPSQVKEINGALTLCPGHPQASAWRQAAKRGQVDIDLEAGGRLFGSGTHLVGKEIKPGTYFVEGEIDGCYWARQNRNGDTIDNDFIPAARRVQVTIRSTDYAFHSERCGTWRPVT